MAEAAKHTEILQTGIRPMTPYIVALVAIVPLLATVLPAEAQQSRDIEVGAYSCTTSHMAGIQHKSEGDIPTSGEINPPPEKQKFTLMIARLTDLSPAHRKQLDWDWGSSIERVRIGPNTFAAVFSKGFFSSIDLTFALGNASKLQIANHPKGAPNQYYVAARDVFSIHYDRSFVAFSTATYAVGRGGVFVLYGQCMQTN